MHRRRKFDFTFLHLQSAASNTPPLQIRPISFFCFSDDNDHHAPISYLEACTLHDQSFHLALMRKCAFCGAPEIRHSEEVPPICFSDTIKCEWFLTLLLLLLRKEALRAGRRGGVIRRIWRGFAESLGINQDQAPCSMSALKAPVYQDPACQWCRHQRVQNQIVNIVSRAPGLAPEKEAYMARLFWRYRVFFLLVPPLKILSTK